MWRLMCVRTGFGTTIMETICTRKRVVVVVGGGGGVDGGMHIRRSPCLACAWRACARGGQLHARRRLFWATRCAAGRRHHGFGSDQAGRTQQIICARAAVSASTACWRGIVGRRVSLGAAPATAIEQVLNALEQDVE